jgi:hypothetical protein
MRWTPSTEISGYNRGESGCSLISMRFSSFLSVWREGLEGDGSKAVRYDGGHRFTSHSAA